MTVGAREQRRLGRAALRARFLLLQRQRHQRLVLEEIGGVSLVVLPDVFHPGLFFSSELLAEVVGREPLEGKQVLAVGTGSGFLALVAARRARRSIGTDINPEAVRALRINALRNNLEDKVEARQANLSGSVTGEQFDVIIFNPPYFAGEAKDLWEAPGGTSTGAGALRRRGRAVSPSGRPGPGFGLRHHRRPTRSVVRGRRLSGHPAALADRCLRRGAD